MTMQADLLWTIIVSTMVLLLFIGLIVLLVLINNNRVIRHHAALGEAERRREREVAFAEREATQQTLREVGLELHDNVAQLLTVAQMGLNLELDTNSSSRHLVAASDALEQGIEEVRRLGHDLNSDMWQERSLADAFSAEAARIERVARIRCLVTLSGTPADLSPDTSTILFRVFQEILNNALKHSGADTLAISLDSNGPLLISIADNGTGFNKALVPTNSGLANIQRRCALVGFSAQCITAPSVGCTWIIQEVEG